MMCCSGTKNIWLVRVAGQSNDIAMSPVTDYAVPTCWAILEVVDSNQVIANSDVLTPNPWRTDPNSADRIEIRCEHKWSGVFC